MSEVLKKIEVEDYLLQLGLYFVDLQNALKPLLEMSETNINSEIDRLNKSHPYLKTRRWFSQSKGVPTVKMIQTLKILDDSVLDLALNISEFNTELKQLKEALDALKEEID